MLISGLLVQWKVGRLEIIVSMIMHNIYIKLKKYEEKFSETTVLEIESQHWDGNRKLSMEGIDVEYFKFSVYYGNNDEKYEFNSYISNYNEHDACD